MSSKPSQKEIAKSVKTLLVLLQSMRGKPVTIQLRNDLIVEGTITKVDGFMNIELLNAVVKRDTFYDLSTEGPTESKVFDYFFAKGPKIRHIQLPEDCDDMEKIKDEINRIRNRSLQWSKRDIVEKDDVEHEFNKKSSRI